MTETPSAEPATGQNSDGASGPSDPRTNTVVWSEFQVPDLDSAQAFYGAVFGWRFTPFGDGFVIASTENGEMVAGLEQSGGEVGTRHVRVYIETADLEAVLDRVTTAGGTVIHGRRVISEEFGWYALVADPSGLAFGLSTSHPAA